MSFNFSLIAPLVTLAFGAIALGGGMYEPLLVDRARPRNPAIIQPAHGGLNRRVSPRPIPGPGMGRRTVLHLSNASAATEELMSTPASKPSDVYR